MKINSKVTSTTTFIQKLLIILQDQQCRPYIQWLESQNGFNITNVSGFSQTVLPTYFKHQNYSSFVRQLNMYGFSKVRGKQGNHVYEHKNFKRGSKSSIRKIQRKVTGEGSRKQDEIVVYRPEIVLSSCRYKQSQLQKMKQRQIQLQQKCTALLQRNKHLLQQNEQITKAIHEQQKKRQNLLSQIISIISNKATVPSITCGPSTHTHPHNQHNSQSVNNNQSQKQTINGFEQQFGQGQEDINLHKEEVPINLQDNQEQFLRIQDFLNVDYDQFSDIFKL